MNNRDYKHFAPNCYYHVYNRGTGKLDIFRNEEDRYFFITNIRKIIFSNDTMGTIVQKSRNGYIPKRLPEGAYSIICYCLMPNHFHFLIRQNLEVPISKLISKLCTSYGKYYNKKYERVGSLFQDAFKSIRVDRDEYLLWLSVYIHQNPKVAGLVDSLDNYKWSSYLDYIGQRQGTLCDTRMVLGNFKNNADYKKFVDDSLSKIRSRKDLEYYLLD